MEAHDDGDPGEVQLFYHFLYSLMFHLLHLGRDVVQAEVGGQCRSALLARGRSHGACR